MYFGFVYFLLLLASILPNALLDRFGIPRETEGKELVEITQKLWYQKGKERWEFDDRYEEMRGELEGVFREMGYLDEIRPKKREYDYVLVHGATLGRVKERVDYLEGLSKGGLKVKKVVFLTGMRKLMAWEKVECGCEWESEMVQWVMEKKGLDGVVVNAVGKRGRPTTADTWFAWLEMKPSGGGCLAISNQPYVMYQDVVIRKRLPEGFELETVGSKAGKWTVALVLDSVARTIYEEEGQ